MTQNEKKEPISKGNIWFYLHNIPKITKLQKWKTDYYLPRSVINGKGERGRYDFQRITQRNLCDDEITWTGAVITEIHTHIVLMSVSWFDIVLQLCKM